MVDIVNSVNDGKQDVLMLTGSFNTPMDENRDYPMTYPIVPHNDNNWSVLIYDKFSDKRVSNILVVPLDKVLIIQSYGFTSVHNPLLNLDTFVNEDIDAIKPRAIEELNRLSKSALVKTPASVIQEITKALKLKHSEKLVNSIVGLLEKANQLENKVLDVLVTPVLDIIILLVGIKNKAVLPVIQELANILDKTWIGQFLHWILNTSTTRPLDEMTGYRVILNKETIPCLCPEPSPCVTLQTGQNNVTQEYNLGYTLKYRTPILGFRHNYTCNVSTIVTPGHYVFEMNCDNFNDRVYVVGYYADRAIYKHGHIIGNEAF